jgi:uncharacterized radical SAM superfamily Fe-S cluster-containing enzyme
MHKPIKFVEKGLSIAANGAWVVFNGLNKINQRPSFTPKWSDKPLLKSYEKTKPPLGWPRETDSLCPTCTREARQAILDGKKDVSVLLNEKVGEIKATILERDGKILMVKDCPIHGHFEDVMAIDTDFFKHLEEVFPGRDIRAHNDSTLHNHGSSTIQHGRGSVLTVDLTNRCNMMCDPCFMDANQVGFVHELSWEDIKTVLDNAITIKPRRQMSVQFSGGEPTISPYFLDAVRYARKVGYNSVQAATNGIEFAKDPEFAKKAAEAGLRYAYLQFDGIGNAANSHRRVGNLFDVKLRAIENLYNNGVDIVPVVTIVNGVNNEQVGRIIEFALDNPKKINFLSFQPVSFTGRDEEVTPERRAAQRYTLSHLAHDVKNQTGIGEPVRDWFPISFMGSFTDWADVTHGAEKEFGQLTCGCHPNCGVGMAIMIDKETKEAVPVTKFLKAERFAKDVQQVTDAGRSRFWSNFGMALAVIRNYDSFNSPTHFKLTDLLKKFDKTVRSRPSRRRKGKYGRSKATGRWTTSPSDAPTAGTSSSSPACGSRTCSTTTSAAPRCASSRMPRSRAKSPSALQHRHRLAQHHREDAHDGDAHEVVRGARPPRDLRRRQEGGSAVNRALAETERRRRPRRRADRSRRARHREERPRREAGGQEAQDPRGSRQGSAIQRRDGQAVRAARAQGAADAADSGARRQEEGIGAGGSSPQAGAVGALARPFPACARM